MINNVNGKVIIIIMIKKSCYCQYRKYYVKYSFIMISIYFTIQLPLIRWFALKVELDNWYVYYDHASKLISHCTDNDISD